MCFEVRKSAVSGRGLFATRTIDVGESIFEFQGAVISLDQVLEKDLSNLWNPLQIGPREYIDLIEPFVFINHSCSPNTGIREDRFLVAIRRILLDEELCFDYSTTMDEKYWTMECACWSDVCRRVIWDFCDLPKDVQERYRNMGIVQAFLCGERST